MSGRSAALFRELTDIEEAKKAEEAKLAEETVLPKSESIVAPADGRRGTRPSRRKSEKVKT